MFQFFPPLMALLLLMCTACAINADHRRFDISPDTEALSYFEENYDRSRDQFLRLSKELQNTYSDVELIQKQVKSQTEQDLTIDISYVPAQVEPTHLLILVAGTHGSEGLASAAVQRHFIEKVLPQYNLDNLGLLLIHGHNPYGMKTFRRVTENNVDLNRNSDVESTLYQNKNEGYEQIDGLLNPREAVNLRSLDNRFFSVKAINNIRKHGMGALRQAVLQGQYEIEDGIYFGGFDHEPHRGHLEPVFVEKTEKYSEILMVDLHTGYGERGTLHLFPTSPDTASVKSGIEQIFEGYQIDWGTSDDFYTVTGDFSKYIHKLLSPNQNYYPMTFEYGTLDSQTTGGSIDSIHRTILENQGHHHGYKRKNDQEKVEALYREMFYPSSEVWRTKIIQDTEQMWHTILPRLQGM